MPIEDVEKIIRKEPIGTYYDVGNELGRGKFAIVKKCTEKSSGTPFAAKVLKKRRHGRSVRADILVEIDIMRQANGSGKQQRIIKLYEVFESSHEFHIVLELATGGELFRVIAIEPLPEEKAREVVYQILDGVQHLHTLNIVHLDLKPENILLYRKGSLDIKIADFGLSVQVKAGQEMKNLVGTAEYVSPEILNFEPLSTFSDMWSIGALTYALMTGYSPFQGETHQETFLNVSMADYDFDDELFDQVSTEAKEFIEKLLILPAKKRLTASKCLQHPWMKARTNLNSSTSSLDSAVCIDSASSMEPSPVSSASSSFGPAPAATTSTSTSTTSTSFSSLSKPEDLKKFNQKLTNEISTLATKRQVADTSTKQRAEDSPTSTDSSTSTLRGDELSESIPTLKDKEEVSTSAERKLESTDSGVEKEIFQSPKSRLTSKTNDLESNSTRSKHSSRFSSDRDLDSKPYTSKYSQESSDALSSSRKPCSRTTSLETKYNSRTTPLEKDFTKSDKFVPRKSYDTKVDTTDLSSSKETKLRSPIERKSGSNAPSLETEPYKEESYKSRLGTRRSIESPKEDSYKVSRTTSLEKDTASESTYKSRLGSRTTSLEKETSSESTYKSRLGSRTTSLEKDTASESTYKSRLGSRTTSLEKDTASESTYKSRLGSRTTFLEKDSASESTRAVSKTTSLEAAKTDSSTSKTGGTLSEKDNINDSSYKSRAATRTTSLEKESTDPLLKSKSSIRTTSMESDTDYGSGSSRSSSLETTPSTKKYTSDKDKHSLDKAPLGREKTSEASSGYKSTTLDRSYKSSYSSTYETRKERERLSDYTSRSHTLDRKSTYDKTSYSARSSTPDRKSTSSTSRQTTTSSDITSLEPATVQSLEKFNSIKLRDHHRPVTPEPKSPDVTELKLLQSPERRNRRKSEGNHPISHQTGRFLRTSETLHEGDEESETGGKKEKKEELEPPQSTSQSSSRSVSPTKTVSTNSDDTRKTRYKPSLDTSYCVDYSPGAFRSSTLGRTPVESAWNDFRSEKRASYRNKRREDDSWLSKTASVSPRTQRRKYDVVDDNLGVGKQTTSKSCDSSPKTSRSVTPTSPPSCKTPDLKSGGSRSITPTSPINTENVAEGDVPKLQKKLSNSSLESEAKATKEESVETKDQVTSSSESKKDDKITSSLDSRKNERYTRRISNDDKVNESPKIVVDTSKDLTPPPPPESENKTGSSSTTGRTRLTTSPCREFRRHKSPDPEKLRKQKVERRKTPVISPEALDMLLSGNVPDYDDALETCIEEDEETTPTRDTKKLSILKANDSCPLSPPKSPEKKVTINSEPSVVVNAPTPTSDGTQTLGERGRLSAEMKERTKSLGTFSPERGSSPVSPEDGESRYDAFTRSMSTRRTSHDRMSRLRGNSLSGSLSSSLSMTDLSQIGKSVNKARRVGRSNSRRLVGKSKIDSYVTDSRLSPSHSYSSTVTTSRENSKTLSGKNLSGKNIDLKERDSSKKSEKSKFRFW